MRVVLDTGILIAALITKDTPPDRIYQAWRKRRFELVTSQWQLVYVPLETRGYLPLFRSRTKITPP